MKNWLIPAVVLIAVGGMGLGVGWSVNEWRDGDEPAPVPTATAQTGPTQAELDAERCKAALAAAGQASSGGDRTALYRGPLKDAIDRYCH